MSEIKKLNDKLNKEYGLGKEHELPAEDFKHVIDSYVEHNKLEVLRSRLQFIMNTLFVTSDDSEADLREAQIKSLKKEIKATKQTLDIYLEIQKELTA